jgi:hypothetical protein
MKRLTLLFALIIGLGIVGCDRPKHRVRHATHKQTVRVHKTKEGRYVYHDPNADLWFYLYMLNQQNNTYVYYSGSLSSYRSSGASWRPVEAKEIEQAERDEIIHEDTQNVEIDAKGNEVSEEVTEHVDAAAVETIEVDVAENGVPVDPSVDLGADGTYETVDTSSSSFDSSDSSSSVDSSSSSDFSSSDSSSSSPD